MTAAQNTDDTTTDETIEVEPAVEGLAFVRSEFNGEMGPEHHWFTIPADHNQADYQDEIDAFIDTRYGLTADDVTITNA